MFPLVGDGGVVGSGRWCRVIFMSNPTFVTLDSVMVGLGFS